MPTNWHGKAKVSPVQIVLSKDIFDFNDIFMLSDV